MSSGIFWVGWRLLVGKGGGLRQAGLIAFGVAIGSVLLFAMSSLPGAVADRQARDSLREWLVSGPVAQEGGLVVVGRDRLGDRSVTHLLISPGSNEVPAIGEALPGRGQALVSPALQQAIDNDSSLAQRVSGEVVGILPDRLLLDPDELISLAVVDPDHIVASGEARTLPTRPPPLPEVAVPSELVFVLAVALLVLALPVVIFISSATQFGLERRRERVRTLSLTGAEPGQIRLFVAMESVAAALLGVLVGFGLFVLARPLFAQLRVGGRAAFSEALGPPLALSLVVVALVMVTAVIASLAGSRRLETQPLEPRTGRTSSYTGFGIVALGLESRS